MSVARQLADLPSASPSTDANFDNGTFVIDVSTDKVGVGTTVPASSLDVQGTVQVGGIPDTIGDLSASLQVEGTDKHTSAISVFRNTDGAGAPAYLMLGKSRGGAVGADTIVQDGDQVGIIRFAAADGVDRVSSVAEIRGQIGGTPGADDTPGELLFMTTADGNAAVTERMRIMADGKVGIGTSAPEGALNVSSTLDPDTDFGDGQYYQFHLHNPQDTTDMDCGIGFGISVTADMIGANIVHERKGADSYGDLAFGTKPSGGAVTERMRIDSSGKVGIGTSAPASLLDVQGTVQVGGIPDAVAGIISALQIEGTTAATASMSIFRNDDGGGNGPYLTLGKSRGSAVGGDTIVADNDNVGTIIFAAADGVDRVSYVAQIQCLIGGTPGADDTPGELLFSTTADGAQAVTERMRIMADGKVGIGTSVPVTDLTIEGTLTLKEQASADADTASYGQIWVKSDAPNSLYFTGDTGVDQALASTGKAIAMSIVFGG